MVRPVWWQWRGRWSAQLSNVLSQSIRQRSVSAALEAGTPTGERHPKRSWCRFIIVAAGEQPTAHRAVDYDAVRLVLFPATASDMLAHRDLA